MPKGDGLTYQQRFWTKVRKLKSGCWIWTAGKNGKGYGYFWMNGKTHQAYKVAHEWRHGKVPRGMDLDHTCRVPACVRHTEVVTRRINQLRGPTTFAAKNAAKTHCPRGHPYDVVIVVMGSKRRWCKRCRSAAALRHYYAHPILSRNRSRRRQRRAFLLSKGRRRITERDLQRVAKKTHCSYGHPFGSPSPNCKTCYNRMWARRKARRTKRAL